jgi:PhnB protein
MRTDIYLNFPGNTEEAFNYYKSVFGVELDAIQRFGETPQAGEVAEEDRDKIMHVSIKLPGGTFLMGTDALESMGQKLTVGNNISITVTPDNRDHADELFAKLSEGGSVQMPMQDAFWGDYFGACTDKFGIPWMLNLGSKE